MSYDAPTPPPPPGGGQMPPAPSGGEYGGVPQKHDATKKARLSMILGIVSLLCCGLITGIPALIIGLGAKKSIDASGGAIPGRGEAIAGIVLGIISIVGAILGVILLLTGAFTLDFSGSTSTS